MLQHQFVFADAMAGVDACCEGLGAAITTKNDVAVICCSHSVRSKAYLFCIDVCNFISILHLMICQLNSAVISYCTASTYANSFKISSPIWPNTLHLIIFLFVSKTMAPKISVGRPAGSGANDASRPAKERKVSSKRADLMLQSMQTEVEVQRMQEMRDYVIAEMTNNPKHM